MDAQAFWNVIGNYNTETFIIQVALCVFLMVAIALSYTKTIKSAAKFALGIVNLFIGAVFFMMYGTETIQHFLPYRYTLL